MATVRQFRFYSLGNLNNSSGGLKKLNQDGTASNEDRPVNYNSLVSGSLFDLSSDTPACQIGIQALPGTKFFLNNGRNANAGIIIGSTGIYELNVENIGINITELQFDFQSIQTINNSPSGYLIVDIVYTN